MSIRGWQTMPTASAIPPQIQEEFAVTLGALDWGRHLACHQVSKPAGKIADRFEDLLMLRRIPNHPTLPHHALADFELWFDKGDDVARRAQKIADMREHQPQGDERDVDDGEVGWGWQPIEAADVDPLQDGHAAVLAPAPGQLPAANVDRGHPLPTAL